MLKKPHAVYFTPHYFDDGIELLSTSQLCGYLFCMQIIFSQIVFFKAQLLIVYINAYVLTYLYYLLLTSFNYQNSIMLKVNSMQYLCLSILMMLAEISISSFNFKFQKAA